LVERRWHTLDDGVLAYALAALRSLWIMPALQLAAWLVSPETKPVLGLTALFGLLAGGTAAAHCAIFLFKGRRAALAVASIGLAAVVAALYFSAGGEHLPYLDMRWTAALVADPVRLLVTVLLAAWLWRWGLLAGSNRVAYDGLARNFMGGLAALLAVAVLNVPAPFMPTGALFAVLLAYMALGLFMLALASIQEARRYESARADHDLPLARHWWSTVAAVVAVLLLAALLISRLVAPAGLDTLAAAAGALLAFVRELALWVIQIVSYPVFWLLAWLAPLLQLQQLEMEPLEGSMSPEFTLQAGEGVQEPIVLSPALQAALGVVGAVAVAALIVLAFVLALRRYRTYVEDDVAESHESILSLDLIKAQLAQLLGRKGTGSAPPAPFVALSSNDPGAQVRRIYQALLAWAAGRGIERPPAMTPDRFRRLLSDSYPQHSEQFAAITAGYDLARYGSGAISGESADAVAAAWRQILAAGAGQDAPGSAHKIGLPAA
jgi:hypothetical protein